MFARPGSDFLPAGQVKSVAMKILVFVMLLAAPAPVFSQTMDSTRVMVAPYQSIQADTLKAPLIKKEKFKPDRQSLLIVAGCFIIQAAIVFNLRRIL